MSDEKEETYSDKTKKNFDICKTCISAKQTPLIGLTCGTFLKPQEFPVKTCGCLVSLKTILHFVTECPQGKW